MRSRRRRPGWAAAVVAFASLVAGSAAAAAGAAPRVVVTITPLHSLVAGVMAGVGEPDLIIRGAGSPHTYSLRPSDARLLENAQVIFRVGGPLETFLEKPLAALGRRARVVEAMRAPGITLLPAREGGPWDEHVVGDHDGHDRGGADAATPAGGHDLAVLDAHLWLDPGNAKVLVRYTADVLGEADPGNRERYWANATALIARIEAVDAELEGLLAPLQGVPFVVFHDAYQYFERRYSLRSVGSVSVSAERRPGAKRIREVRAKIRDLGARCVFSEPQFPSAILGTVTEGTGVRTAALDPLGVDLPPGPEAWFMLVRNLGAAFASCLR